MALVRSSVGDKMGRNLPFTALSPIVERRGKPRPRTPLMLSVKCTVEAFAKPNSSRSVIAVAAMIYAGVYASKVYRSPADGSQPCSAKHSL